MQRVMLSALLISACVQEPLPLEALDAGGEACSATLTIAPRSINVGAIDPDRTVARTVEVSITNVGGAPCRLVASELRVDEATPIRSERPSILPAGETIRWNEDLLIATGALPIPRTVATITVYFEQRDPLAADVTLAGSISASTFVVTPATLDFGTRAIGCEVRRTVSVVNTGSNPLTLTVSPPRIAPFTVDGASSPIPSGALRVYDVTMQLADEGDHTATVRFEANGAEAQDLALRGRGTPPAPCD